MADENKSEKATPRRRQKAREQGRVARSREFPAAAAVGAMTLVTACQMSAGIGSWKRVFRWAVEQSGSELRLTGGLSSVSDVAWKWLLPGMGASLALASVVSVAQGGLVIAPALLKPSPGRLSPVNKLKQILSIQSVAALGKSLLPTAAMLYLVVGVISRNWTVICGSSELGIRGLARWVGVCLLEIGWKCALVLLVWSAVDYFVERQKFERDLRMSQQEIREEAKESEGNPQVKARIRRLQRQVRRKRMLDDVKRATVVITNPTEYAIALEYNHNLAAPVVVAKGRNLLAQQIKEAARWCGVPLVENVPLAHALYRTAEVGQAIPAKLYAAVAEVLAFIMRAQARVAAGGRR